MSQQPEAIRLAAVCDLGHPLEDDVVLIGPELLRLHAVESGAKVELMRRDNLIDSLHGLCESYRTQVESLQVEISRLQSAPVTAVPALVPLSDEQLASIYANCPLDNGFDEFVASIREYESARGITQNRVAAPKPALVCNVCGVDRLKEDCKGDRMRCGMQAVGYGIGLTVGDGAHSGALHCKKTWWRWVGTQQYEHGRATYYCDTVNEVTVSMPNFEQAFALANAIEAQAKETRHDARYGLLQEIGRITP